MNITLEQIHAPVLYLSFEVEDANRAGNFMVYQFLSQLV